MGMLRQGASLLAKRRDFSFLMGAQFLAQAGDGLVQGALAKLIVFGGQKGFDVEGARSPDELLRIVLYIFIPYTIISPFLGVVIDRWDRRRLLFVANGLRAVVIALIGLVGTTSVGELVLFLAFLLTLASTRVVLATKSAALPETVDRTALVEANALSQFGGAIFQLGGAGVAIVAATVLDAEPIVLAGALVYGAGAFFALGIRRAGEARAKTTFMQEVARVARNILDGVHEVAHTPKAAASITTYFWLRLLWSFSIVGIGFVSRDLLADSDLGVLLITGGAGAAGAALGFMMANRLSERVSTTAQLVLAASAIAGVAVAVLGALELPLTLGLLTFCLGFGFFLGKISLDTMVQESLGDNFRGRAFSLYDIAYNLAWVVAAAIMKLLWAGVGQVLISAMGVAFLIGIAAIGVWFRRAGLLGPRLSAESGRGPQH
ncbi:MAG: MFS transporter [Actinobacteria bacterium]|nr:MFS transporter [Actinomycetota bacterium]